MTISGGILIGVGLGLVVVALRMASGVRAPVWLGDSAWPYLLQAGAITVVFGLFLVFPGVFSGVGEATARFIGIGKGG